MNSYLHILDNETETIFAASSNGANVKRISITNADSGSITVNLFISYKNASYLILAKDTAIAAGAASVLLEGDIYLNPYHKLKCVTTGETHIQIVTE